MPGNDKKLNKGEMKDLRRENPSAWLELTDNQTLPLVIDALLDAPPGKEFNKKELGDYSGLSRESIREYIDVLVKFGIVKIVPGTNPTRYALNDRGKATKAIFELNSALNSAGSGEEKNLSNLELEDYLSSSDRLVSNTKLFNSTVAFGNEIEESLG